MDAIGAVIIGDAENTGTLTPAPLTLTTAAAAAGTVGQGNPIFGDPNNTGLTAAFTQTTAAGLVGNWSVSAVNTLLTVDMTGGAAVNPSDAVGSITLASPLISSVVGAQGALLNGNVAHLNGNQGVWPPLMLLATMDGPPMELALLQASGMAAQSWSMQGNLTMAPFTLRGDTLQGTSAQGEALFEPLAVTGLTGLRGEVSIEPLMVLGRAAAGLTYDGTPILERATLNASALNLPLTNASSSVSLSVSAAGVAHAGLAAQGQVTLTAPGVQAQGLSNTLASAQALLAPATLAASGVTGAGAQGALSLAVPVLVGLLSAPPPGNTALATLVWPALTGTGTAHSDTLAQGSVTVAPWGLAAAAATGRTLDGALDLRTLGLSAAASAPPAPAPDNTAFAALVWPLGILSAQAHGGTRSQGAASLPAVAGTAQGLSGLAAMGACTLATLALQATASAPAPDNLARGTADLRLPEVAAQSLHDNLAVGLATWSDARLAAQALTGQAGAGQAPWLAPVLAAQASALGVNNTATAEAILLAPGAAALLAAGPLLTGQADLRLQVLARGVTGQRADFTPDGPRLQVQGSAQAQPLDGTATGAAALAGPALAGELHGGPLARAELNWPALGLQAGALAGTLASGAAALAAPALTAQLSAPAPDNLLTGDITLPAWRLTTASLLGSGQSAGALQWATPALQALGAAGNAAQADLGLALPALAGALEAPPAPDAAMQGAAVWPALALQAQAYAGPLARASLLLAAPTLDAQATASTLAAGQAELLAFGLLAKAGADAVQRADVQLTLPALALQGASSTGNVAYAELTLTLVKADADGVMQTLGTAQVRLPLLALSGGALVQTLAAPVFTGLALNPRSQALSRYEGVQANSLCVFGGLTLAATESGIVALTGPTDLGRPIAAQVAGGVGDLGVKTAKTVIAGFVGYHAGGALELTLITDTHHEHVYRLEPRQLGQQHASRVKFGRGVQGSYWQWALANTGGADFALDSLSLDVLTLQRRIAR